MPDPSTLLAFTAAVLTMQIMPGPDIALLVSRGVGQGRRIALWTAVGMTVGAGAVQVPLLGLGVASVIASLPAALNLIRWLGAGYLVFLGVKLLRNAGRANVSAPALRPLTALAAARQGMVNNLTNPKPLVFMLAFLPQFVDPAHGSVGLQLAVLATVQKLCGLCVMGAMAILAGTVGTWLSRKMRLIAWQERLTGAAMVALGLFLLAGDGRSTRV